MYTRATGFLPGPDGHGMVVREVGTSQNSNE